MKSIKEWHEEKKYLSIRLENKSLVWKYYSSFRVWWIEFRSPIFKASASDLNWLKINWSKSKWKAVNFLDVCCIAIGKWTNYCALKQELKRSTFWENYCVRPIYLGRSQKGPLEVIKITCNFAIKSIKADRYIYKTLYHRHEGEKNTTRKLLAGLMITVQY